MLVPDLSCAALFFLSWYAFLRIFSGGKLCCYGIRLDIRDGSKRCWRGCSVVSLRNPPCQVLSPCGSIGSRKAPSTFVRTSRLDVNTRFELHYSKWEAPPHYTSLLLRTLPPPFILLVPRSGISSLFGLDAWPKMTLSIGGAMSSFFDSGFSDVCALLPSAELFALQNRNL